MSARDGEFDQLLALVESQRRTIERLTAHVRKEPVERPVAPPDPASGRPAGKRPRPIDWWTLSGRERQDTWGQLSEFVEALVRRYSLQLVILPCWWRHNEAVEELTALWEVRKICFGENADPRGGTSWLDGFNKSVDRLRGFFGSCREGHLNQDIGVWMTPGGRAEFRKAVIQDAEEHPRRDR
jgi:hypothetical protein